MSENLLEAPERGAIEALLKQSNGGLGEAPTFERLLGFMSGAVITPIEFFPEDWVLPLFELNGVVLTNVEDIEAITASLLSLYERLDVMNYQKEAMFPFDLTDPEIVNSPEPILDWATGLHCAVMSQEDMWIPAEGEADFIDEQLMRDVNLNIQSLTTLVDPSSIPEILKDPVPFQRNILCRFFPEWREDMIRQSWDDQLIGHLRLFCISRLDVIFEILQRYSVAYKEGETVVIDLRELNET